LGRAGAVGSGPIEDRRGHGGFRRPLAGPLARLGGRVDGGALPAEVLLRRGGGGESVALVVVDELGVDVSVAPKDCQARPFGRSVDLASHALMTTSPSGSAGGLHHLPAFPALRRTYSPT